MKCLAYVPIILLVILSYSFGKDNDITGITILPGSYVKAKTILIERMKASNLESPVTFELVGNAIGPQAHKLVDMTGFFALGKLEINGDTKDISIKIDKLSYYYKGKPMVSEVEMIAVNYSNSIRIDISGGETNIIFKQSNTFELVFTGKPFYFGKKDANTDMDYSLNIMPPKSSSDGNWLVKIDDMTITKANLDDSYQLYIQQIPPEKREEDQKIRSELLESLISQYVVLSKIANDNWLKTKEGKMMTRSSVIQSFLTWSVHESERFYSYRC